MLKSQIEELNKLVTRVHLINHTWKACQALFKADSALAMFYRDEKAKLQAILLRHSENIAYLRVDEALSHETGEVIYSVTLTEKAIANASHSHKDAAHMPQHIAQQLFTNAEIAKFTKGTT